MNFIPLALLQRMVISRFRAEFAKESDLLSSEHINELISNAYVELVRDSWLLTASVTRATTATAFAFSMPDDVLDQLITRIRVRDSSGHFVSPGPERRSWDFMRDHYGDFSNPSGLVGAADWAVNADNQEQLIVQNTPGIVHATGLAIDYVQNPGDLGDVYDQEAVTVAVTNGSTLVTFASTIAGLVLADMAFGVKAAADQLPRRWYRIASIGSTVTATLSEVYAGVTQGAATFVASPVSPLEYKRRGLVRYAPVEYAMMMLADVEEGTKAAEPYGKLWAAQLARIRSESYAAPGLKPAQDSRINRHPALRRKRAPWSGSWGERC